MMGTNITRFGSREADKYMLRLPDGMRDRIKAIAAANGRSMNAELLSTLVAAYPAPVEPESINGRLLDASAAVLAEHERILRAIGQDPEQNDNFTALRAKIIEANDAP